MPSAKQTLSGIAYSGSSNYGNCMYENTAIQVTNCGLFYVYYLKWTGSCSSGYCAGRIVIMRPESRMCIKHCCKLLQNLPKHFNFWLVLLDIALHRLRYSSFN